jgi:hypothetical protein
VGTRCIADVDSYFFGLRTASVAGLKSLWKFNQCLTLIIVTYDNVTTNAIACSYPLPSGPRTITASVLHNSKIGMKRLSDFMSTGLEA